MLATAFGRLHCKGLPLPPSGGAKENVQEHNENSQPWEDVHLQVSCHRDGGLLDVVNPPRQATAKHQDTPEHAFEQRLQDVGEDVVVAWCEYVQWTAQNRHSDDEMKVLARACFALAGDDKHKDDIRHLRLWVRHAANTSEAEKVFDFLAAEGIGLHHALLYEAWASHLERQRKFSEAEQQYRLGLQRAAEPQERLRSRHQEFQRRMCKRAARKGPKPAPAACTKQDLIPISPPAVKPVAATEGFAVHEDTGLQIGGDEDDELPVHEKMFVPIQGRRLALDETELPATQTLLPRNTSLDEVTPAPRVLARIGGTAEWKALRGPMPRSSQASERSQSRASLHSCNATSELTGGLRSMLADANRRRSSSGDVFEDPTCTAELAQREILALFATDREPAAMPRTGAPLMRHLGATAASSGWGRETREASPRTSGAFEIFEETDFSVGR